VRTNYVLIDYESVQTTSLEQLAHDHFKVIVFVGASQAKLPVDVVMSLQRLGSRAQYIKISGHGSNALDFHIAYYIGRLAVDEPSAYFHIISKDTGFDPLITHLRSKKIFASRVPTVADIPVLKALNSRSPQERIAVILARLHQLKGSKPRTVKTLNSTIASLFPNALSENEIALLVQGLAKQGHLEVAGAKVIYASPAESLTKPLQRTRR
jgi:PIN domain